jgi:hypothetical protein
VPSGRVPDPSWGGSGRAPNRVLGGCPGRASGAGLEASRGGRPDPVWRPPGRAPNRVLGGSGEGAKPGPGRVPDQARGGRPGPVWEGAGEGDIPLPGGGKPPSPRNRPNRPNRAKPGIPPISLGLPIPPGFQWGRSGRLIGKFLVLTASWRFGPKPQTSDLAGLEAYPPPQGGPGEGLLDPSQEASRTLPRRGRTPSRGGG